MVLFIQRGGVCRTDGASRGMGGQHSYSIKALDWSSHTSFDMRHTTEAIVNIQDTRYLFNLSISQLSPFTELWEEVQIYVYPEPGITPKAIVHFTWPKQ